MSFQFAVPPPPQFLEEEEGPTPVGGELAPPNLGAPPELARMTSGYGQFGGYFEGEETAILRTMAPDVLARLQQQLVTLGLTSKVVVGEVDESTIAGFSRLLAMANQRRERWQETMTRSVNTMAEHGLLPEQDNGTAEVYLAPDYATLSRRVKGMFRDQLRRDPTDAELALLADEMSGMYRSQFDEAIGASQEADNVGAGRVVEGQQVDPVARFEELFESRFSGELEQVKDTDDRQQQVDVGTTILDSFGRIGMGSAS